jgi:transposase
MINYEDYMQIKILYKQGKSIREISRIMKMSRNTIRRYLRNEGEPIYKGRANRLSKLHKYYGYLAKRTEEAKPYILPGTVLFREIKEMGYQGGISTLNKYLRKNKPKTKEEPIVRFETNPGQQMQVDWVVFRRGKDSLSAFVATMGYSRASFVEFVSNERLETLLFCHERAFEYFGGIPKEILYDNMKTVVIERNKYGKGKHRFQLGFLDFAGHHGFIPRLCSPYRAKTKGKVERFNRYLRQCFYNPLASRLKPLGLEIDKELANYEVKRWLRDIANQRTHATTNMIPAQRLEEEHNYLQKLQNPYIYLKVAQPINKNIEFNISNIYSIQHPLSLYDALLQEDVV